MSERTETIPSLAQEIGEAIGMLMAEVMQSSAEDMLRLIQREDLSMPRVTALMMLARCDGATISEISHHLNLSLATTSGVVDRLVAGGFVTRQEDQQDRRQKQVALTARGREVVREIKRTRLEVLTRRLANVPEPVLETTHVALRDLLAHLKRD
jgi:DNA-binding MarR family transcriptional regulator